MIGEDILIKFYQWVPAGERSDFVNGALEEALIYHKREQAFKAMDELRLKAKIKMTDAEIIKRKNYGRP
ncbi:hypothetical protein HZA42_01980 [Candidatus Peregrinibacteria bacterium]|nr:hypothetical protein [Candidatus Peregrinibacteria bacterium]